MAEVLFVMAAAGAVGAAVTRFIPRPAHRVWRSAIGAAAAALTAYILLVAFNTQL